MVNLSIRRGWLIALLLVVFIHSKCIAAVRTWDGSSDGDGDNIHWEDDLNWNADIIPGPTDDADVGIATPLVRTTELFLIADLTTGAVGGVDIQGALSATGGTVKNNGEIFIDNGATAGPADFSVGVGTLEGTGAVILGDSDFANGGAKLNGPTTGGSATQVAGHTIRGEGTITGNWINEGLIRPEDVSGDLTGILRITGSMTNHGILRSSAAGDLDFNTGAVGINQGTTGRIISDTRKIALKTSTIIGGTLEAVNGGYFDTIGNSLHLNSVRNLARIDMVSGVEGVPTMTIEGGGLTNDGTIVVQANAAAGGGTIQFSVPGVIGGTGEIILNREGLGARIAGSVQGTNGASHSIRGVGGISAPFVNDGTIIAEPRGGGTILVLDGSAKTNNNVIRADTGGILRLGGFTLTQTATGRVVANQGVVELTPAPTGAPNVVGGLFETVGGGSIVVTASGTAARIDDITNAGVLNIQSARTLAIGGSSLTNNGTITLQATTGALGGANLTFANDVTVSGTGSIVLTPELPFLVNRILVPTGVTATQANGHTIRGEGIINGFDNFGTLINNGRIEGTSATQNLEINGTLGGSGLLKNVQINGTHSPGASTTIVPVEGAYALSTNSARLAMELGGTTPGTSYDQLASTDPTSVITIGSATTNTTLDVSLINSFIPATGNLFTLISTTGTLTGQFDTVNLPGSAGGNNLTWAVHYNSSNVTLEVLSVVAGVPGDYNNNGVVDAGDYVLWRKHNNTATTLPNDSTPGTSPADYTVWRSHFGQPPGSGSGASAHAAIPEPATCLLLMFGAAGWCLPRRRQNRMAQQLGTP